MNPIGPAEDCARGGGMTACSEHGAPNPFQNLLQRIREATDMSAAIHLLDRLLYVLQVACNTNSRYEAALLLLQCQGFVSNAVSEVYLVDRVVAEQYTAAIVEKLGEGGTPHDVPPPPRSPWHYVEQLQFPSFEEAATYEGWEDGGVPEQQLHRVKLLALRQIQTGHCTTSVLEESQSYVPGFFGCAPIGCSSDEDVDDDRSDSPRGGIREGGDYYVAGAGGVDDDGVLIQGARFCIPDSRVPGAGHQQSSPTSFSGPPGLMEAWTVPDTCGSGRMSTVAQSPGRTAPNAPTKRGASKAAPRKISRAAKRAATSHDADDGSSARDIDSACSPGTASGSAGRSTASRRSAAAPPTNVSPDDMLVDQVVHAWRRDAANLFLGSGELKLNFSQSEARVSNRSEHPVLQLAASLPCVHRFVHTSPHGHLLLPIFEEIVTTPRALAGLMYISCSGCRDAGISNAVLPFFFNYLLELGVAENPAVLLSGLWYTTPHPSTISSDRGRSNASRRRRLETHSPLLASERCEYEVSHYTLFQLLGQSSYLTFSRIQGKGIFEGETPAAVMSGGEIPIVKHYMQYHPDSATAAALREVQPFPLEIGGELESSRTSKASRKPVIDSGVLTHRQVPRDSHRTNAAHAASLGWKSWSLDANLPDFELRRATTEEYLLASEASDPTAGRVSAPIGCAAKGETGATGESTACSVPVVVVRLHLAYLAALRKLDGWPQRRFRVLMDGLLLLLRDEENRIADFSDTPQGASVPSMSGSRSVAAPDHRYTALSLLEEREAALKALLRQRKRLCSTRAGSAFLANPLGDASSDDYFNLHFLATRGASKHNQAAYIVKHVAAATTDVLTRAGDVTRVEPPAGSISGKLKVHQQESLWWTLRREELGVCDYTAIQLPPREHFFPVNIYSRRKLVTCFTVTPQLAAGPTKHHRGARPGDARVAAPTTLTHDATAGITLNDGLQEERILLYCPMTPSCLVVPRGSYSHRCLTTPIKGGFLSDEMGLGKTLVLLSLAASNPQQATLKHVACSTPRTSAAALSAPLKSSPRVKSGPPVAAAYVRHAEVKSTVTADGAISVTELPCRVATEHQWDLLPKSFTEGRHRGKWKPLTDSEKKSIGLACCLTDEAEVAALRVDTTSEVLEYDGRGMAVTPLAALGPPPPSMAAWVRHSRLQPTPTIPPCGGGAEYLRQLANSAEWSKEAVVEARDIFTAVVGGDAALKREYATRNDLIPSCATLIVVPLSLAGQWISEIERFAPRASYILFHGAKRHEYSAEHLKRVDFIVTTYETLAAQLRQEELRVDQLFTCTFPHRDHLNVTTPPIKELTKYFRKCKEYVKGVVGGGAPATLAHDLFEAQEPLRPLLEKLRLALRQERARLSKMASALLVDEAVALQSRQGSSWRLLSSLKSEQWLTHRFALDIQDKFLACSITPDGAEAPFPMDDYELALMFGTCGSLQWIAADAKVHGRHRVSLLKFRFHRVVLDESQKCTLRSPLHLLHATHRWVVSGTPINNGNIASLKPLVQFIGLQGTYECFSYPPAPVHLHGHSYDSSSFLIFASNMYEARRGRPLYRWYRSYMNRYSTVPGRTVDEIEAEEGALTLSPPPPALGAAQVVMDDRRYAPHHAFLTQRIRGCVCEGCRGGSQSGVFYFSELPCNGCTAVTPTQVSLLLAGTMIRHEKNDVVRSSMAIPERTLISVPHSLLPDELALYEQTEQIVYYEFCRLLQQGLLGNRMGRVLFWIQCLCRLALHPCLAQRELLRSSGDSLRLRTNITARSSPTHREASSGESVVLPEVEAVTPAQALEWLQSLEGEAAGKRSRLTMASGNAVTTPSDTLQIVKQLSEVPPIFPDCTVCLDSMVEPTLTTCFHFYCRECVLGVITSARQTRDGLTTARCPLCRDKDSLRSRLRVITVHLSEESLPAAAPLSASSDMGETGSEELGAGVIHETGRPASGGLSTQRERSGVGPLSGRRSGVGARAEPGSSADSAAEPEQQVAERLERIGSGSRARCIISLLHSTIWGNSQSEPLEGMRGPTRPSSDNVIIFSKFPSFLHILLQELRRTGISCDIIEGSTSMTRRRAILRMLQTAVSSRDDEMPGALTVESEAGVAASSAAAPSAPVDNGLRMVLLLSSRAAGTGLNLTFANHLIFAEPNLNPALELQAMGRVHRFGQTKPVRIYHVFAVGTVEERLQRRMERLLATGDHQVAPLESPTHLAAVTHQQQSRMSTEELQEIFAPSTVTMGER